jgi:hypothetical protein
MVYRMSTQGTWLHYKEFFLEQGKLLFLESWKVVVSLAVEYLTQVVGCLGWCLVHTELLLLDCCNCNYKFHQGVRQKGMIHCSYKLLGR